MNSASESPLACLTPFRIGNLTLKNRFVRCATFEGMASEMTGFATDRLIQLHAETARGGVAMTTVAYASVSGSGRSFSNQIWVREEAIPSLTKLTDAIHREGAAASIQITHAGYFSDEKVGGEKALGPSVIFNPGGMNWCREMTLEDIERVTSDFADAADVCRRSGFDAIEVHFGHGYLLSQFISPWSNVRTDDYGGSVENRMRFPLQVLRRVRQRLGPEFPIIAKFNVYDGFSGGLEIDDALVVARLLSENGASVLQPSEGYIAKTGMSMLKGDVPLWQMILNMRKWTLKIGLLLFGWYVIKREPFTELFLMDAAKKVMAVSKVPVMLIGGVRSLENIDAGLGAGFELIWLGRALVAEPDFVRKIETAKTTKSCCVSCNDCVGVMQTQGVYCVYNAQRHEW
eukprot:TRINITY_DN4193_c0_g2_i1.p1 TRINITY_DN4193_c0_g2~~TRINITY_DN4193_c0_g2_i1.p1  ORF type:complete len:402 (-),score=104.56 TRINITY_DN4193_c0_g2_i1:82-1287(-)